MMQILQSNFFNVIYGRLCRRLCVLRNEVKFEGEAFKPLIGGSTAGSACSMQGD